QKAPCARPQRRPPHIVATWGPTCAPRPQGREAFMTALGYGVVAFVCTLASALLGIFIRGVLPPSHLTKESQDVVRLGMGLVATMTALLLGLVTASAKSTFDSQDAAIKNASASVIALDRILARYGAETRPTRELLRKAVAARIDSMWPADGSR